MKKKEMLINVLQPEECRIAIVEDGVLEELYIERASQESYVGNIYKGRIVNIEPSIQAAFVDFGIGRNGFLHVSDVDPAYYRHLLTPEQWAEYERSLMQEHEGPAGGRTDGRSRRSRQTPPPETPTPQALPTPEAPPIIGAETDYESEEFAAGIWDEATPLPATPDTTTPVAAATPTTPLTPPPSAEAAMAEEIPDEADEFAAGIWDEASPAAIPSTTPITEDQSSPPTPAATATETEDDFAAGIWDTSSPAPANEALAPPLATTPQGDAVTPAAAPPAPELPVAAAEPSSSEPAATIAPPPIDNTDTPTVPSSPPAAENAASVPAADAAPPATATRRRRRTTKTEQPQEVTSKPDTTTTEDKPKPRTRRRRKSDTTPPATEIPAAEATQSPVEVPPPASPEANKSDPSHPRGSEDDKPRYMGGAEHRTHPAGDEPEIEPFYEGIGDYDPNAPNDRFVSPAAEATAASPVDHEFAADPESAIEAEEEARELARTEAEADLSESVESVADDVAAAEELAATSPPSGRRPAVAPMAPAAMRAGRGRGRDRRTSRGPAPASSRSGRDRGLPKPKIEEIFKKGQEVIVQVIKEAVGTKGPTLSTYISIAGRYLVLMPSLNRVGVSRKIEDPEARRRLRQIMNALSPPKGVGFIVRTAAVDRDLAELRNDLIYLLRLWQVVVRRIKRVAAPVEIYRESDMITRTIRDIFTSDIDTIWVDEPNAFAHASEFLQIVMPKFANRIRYYDSTEPLFHRYGLEEEIAKIYQKRIELPQGGSIVIEQTEALVAIDVNSGNFRADNNNAEETAFQMNLIAAKEIARQLRLRDLGGVIVNDFIDMRSEHHRRKVEETLREALRRDRARTKILRISQFGIIEMTRQRVRPSIKRSIFTDCPYCKGNGYVKTTESVAIEAMRLLQLAAHYALQRSSLATVQMVVQLDVANYLLNRRRREIVELEQRANISIQITGQPHLPPDTLTLHCFDHNGNEVRLNGGSAVKLSGGRVPNGVGRLRERRTPPALEAGS